MDERGGYEGEDIMFRLKYHGSRGKGIVYGHYIEDEDIYRSEEKDGEIYYNKMGWISGYMDMYDFYKGALDADNVGILNVEGLEWLEKKVMLEEI